MKVIRLTIASFQLQSDRYYPTDILQSDEEVVLGINGRPQIDSTHVVSYIWGHFAPIFAPFCVCVCDKDLFNALFLNAEMGIIE